MSGVIENLDVGVVGSQSPHQSSRVPSGPASQAIFFNEHSSTSPLGEVVQCRAADNASACKLVTRIHIAHSSPVTAKRDIIQDQDS